MSAVAANTEITPVSRSLLSNTFAWLIRRELWEYRGRFLIAPLIVAAIAVVATIYTLIRIDSSHVTVLSEGIEFMRNAARTQPEMLNVGGIVLTMAVGVPFYILSFFVTVHYALDTLHADRRDRSILFWKSLPVSDVETVLSKLSIATLVAPLITLVIALLTTYLLCIIFSAAMAMYGQPTLNLWAHFPFLKSIVVLFYTLMAYALWYLPIWSWCLLASAWANRVVFLWATVPIAGLAWLEYLSLGTNNVLKFVDERFNGVERVAFNIPADFEQRIVKDDNGVPVSFGETNVFEFLTPGEFFSSPDLWVGIAMTVAFVGGAVWLRRFRDAA